MGISLDLFVKEYDLLTDKDKERVWHYIKRLNELKKPKKAKEEYAYLNILSFEVQTFVLDILEEYNLNLYHSVASIINNPRRRGWSVDEIIEFYYKKYSVKRPYILDNEDCMVELISMVYDKLHR